LTIMRGSFLKVLLGVKGIHKDSRLLGLFIFPPLK
jgi:hypothetical protein